jgi:hypothetical protein
MSRILLFFSVLVVLVLSSCIKDDILEDFVQPEIRISGSIDTLGVDSVFAFQARFFNNIGQDEDIEITWTSSDESIATVNAGQVRGVSEGDAIISASYFYPEENLEVTASEMITVGEAILPPPVEDPLRIIDGVIRTTTFYPLEGDFQFIEEEEGVTIDIASNYIADNRLPGLYIYLSNNRNSIAGALEIAEVTQFSGAHTYSVPEVEFEDYAFIVYFCKPFNVKVGEAELNF